MNENNSLLSALTREGVLISVSVRYWRATKKLKAEDLGLNPNNVTDRLISLGHKRLLPKDALAAFNLIEGRAHALVESSTFPFLNVARFLPNTKLQEVTAQLTLLEGEFKDAAKKFVASYAELRKEAQREWKKAAKRLVADPEQLLETIENSFPSPARMERQFAFEVQMFQVKAPERLTLQAINVADQQEIINARQLAAQQATEKINQGAEEFLAECVATMRQETSKLCEEMLTSISNGKTGCHQKTLNRLVKFIDDFKQLNFVGDTEMEAQLEKARQQLLTRSAEEYRDNPAAGVELRHGLQALANKAKQLASQDARELVEAFGQVGRRKISLAA